MIDDYQVHDVARLFPRISGEARELLRDDVRKHGVRVPITVWNDGTQDLIIDGRNRYEVLRELTDPAGENLTHTTESGEVLDCPVFLFQGTEEEAIAEAMRLNSLRRHLTASQLAGLAVLAEEMLERSGGDSPADAQALADLWGTNRNYIFDARRLLKAGARDLLEKVVSGENSIRAVLNILERREAGLPDVPDAEEEEAAPTPVKKPTPLDGLKRVVPKALEVVFATVPSFREAAKRVKDVERMVEDLANGPGGAGLPRQITLHKIKQLRRDILQAMPFVPCPYCDGKGRVQKKECGRCNGTAVLDALQFKQLPDPIRTGIINDSGGTPPDDIDD